GSKSFAKDVMDAAGVASARTPDRPEPPCVVKLDGLAAGKGVWVCRTQAELDEALAAAEPPFHAEELLEGPELPVVAVAGDDPAAGDRGTPIEGVEAAEATGALVFHAGTGLQDGRLVTNGGRVLNVVGVGDDVTAARTAAYEAVACIDFAGMQFRTDIASV